MPLRKCFTLTPARIEANRRSAQKFTSPRTARGKVPSQMNARRNGVRLPLDRSQASLVRCPARRCGQSRADADYPFAPEKTPMEATMFMKMQELRGNFRNRREIVCY
jgi:hypothetical protein